MSGIRDESLRSTNPSIPQHIYAIDLGLNATCTDQSFSIHDSSNGFGPGSKSNHTICIVSWAAFIRDSGLTHRFKEKVLTTSVPTIVGGCNLNEAPCIIHPDYSFFIDSQLPKNSGITHRIVAIGANHGRNGSKVVYAEDSTSSHIMGRLSPLLTTDVEYSHIGINQGENIFIIPLILLYYNLDAGKPGYGHVYIGIDDTVGFDYICDEFIVLMYNGDMLSTSILNSIESGWNFEPYICIGVPIVIMIAVLVHQTLYTRGGII